MRRLAAAILAVAVSSCATSRHVETLPSGVTVHGFRREYTTAYLVTSGQAAVLFDSGLERNAAALDGDLRRAGVDPARLGAIVLSHGHADHAGGARWFRERYGTRVVAGKGDRSMLEGGHNDRLCPTGDDARGRVEADQAERFTPLQPDVEVETELDLEPLAGVPARVVALPGHTPGSVVLIAGGAVLVGDLFRGSILGASARVHFYMCDLEDNRRDVHALLELAPSATRFFPGHFGPLDREAVVATFGTR